MPSFAISSVDTGANTLTSTGVAAAGGAAGTVLTTGDRFRLRNVGGALPAATPSLAGATDYWARRVDDNTIQVYDSNAHALAGGGTGLVDLTGSGSGTTTIEFGLPYALPTVIPAPGVQVDSQRWLRPSMDALIALYDLLTGQAQAIWSAITVAVAVTFNAGVTFLQDLTLASNKNVVLQGSGNVKHGTWTKIIQANANGNTHSWVVIDSSTIFAWDIHLDPHFQVGDTITAIRANCTDNAGGTRVGVTIQTTTDGTAAEFTATGGTQQITSGTAGALHQLTFSLSEAVAAGKSIRANFVPSGGTAAVTVWTIEVDWTR